MPVRASICNHAVSSLANWTTATQIWFCANAVKVIWSTSGGVHDVHDAA